MAIPTTSASTTATSNQRYTVPLMIVTTLFFLFGFVTNLNDILIPHLKRACELTDFQSAFVQFAFFGAYFIMSLPAGVVLERIGYQKGIVLGLVICALGAFLFYPAAVNREYLFFLIALAILASGITLLQVAANPYVSVLGPPQGAASRLSLMGAFNSLAGTLAPFVGGLLFLKGIDYTLEQIQAMTPAARETYLNGEAALVQTPYLILGSVLLGLAAMVFYTKMPAIESLHNENEPALATDKTSALQYPHLVLGIIAIFVYVGAEVGIGSFMIRYGQSQGIEGYNDLMGSQFVAYYWGSAMVGRFIGIPLLARINAAKALAMSCVLAIALVLLSVFTSGKFALFALAAVGLCNSIMWPVIFPMGIKGLGIFTKKGSSLLIMAVVGGALFPLLIGYLSDKVGINTAYLAILPCYVFIMYYAISGHKQR
jgi:FHS family L-fucose permease-like MFS transporter